MSRTKEGDERMPKNLHDDTAYRSSPSGIDDHDVIVEEKEKYKQYFYKFTHLDLSSF